MKENIFPYSAYQKGIYLLKSVTEGGLLEGKVLFKVGGLIEDLRHSKILPLRSFFIRNSGPEFFQEQLGNKASKGEQ